MFSISYLYRMVFIRDCDASGNVVESNTHEDIWELWCRCVESSSRVGDIQHWNFVETEVFASYENSSSNFDSDERIDNDIILVSSFQWSTRSLMGLQIEEQSPFVKRW